MRPARTFTRFWLAMNTARVAAGLQAASYNDARSAWRQSREARS